MRISDWSSDVCSSDLRAGEGEDVGAARRFALIVGQPPRPGKLPVIAHRQDRARAERHRLGRIGDIIGRHGRAGRGFEAKRAFWLAIEPGVKIGRASWWERGWQYV